MQDNEDETSAYVCKSMCLTERERRGLHPSGSAHFYQWTHHRQQMRPCYRIHLNATSCSTSERFAEVEFSSCILRRPHSSADYAKACSDWKTPHMQPTNAAFFSPVLMDRSAVSYVALGI
ncbi:uncharacterized protein LOC119776119 isoform X2 [Cyprinodon tularosa]|uniref:uncharacterized protein LOC119776119 isoform X2 n=1 Tax=Cyprinodon tularosa TaxID=77115 RepID=UPI0018E1E35D|nr:uncharacterized protein LOC119776119 isoform X2 [Cyprinodon tularosa]